MRLLHRTEKLACKYVSPFKKGNDDPKGHPEILRAATLTTRPGRAGIPFCASKGRAASWVCGEKMPFSAPGVVSLQRAFGERPNRAVGVTPSSRGPGWQNTEPKRIFLDL